VAVGVDAALELGPVEQAEFVAVGDQRADADVASLVDEVVEVPERLVALIEGALSGTGGGGGAGGDDGEVLPDELDPVAVGIEDGVLDPGEVPGAARRAAEVAELDRAW
jgi:hypothetical protein